MCRARARLREHVQGDRRDLRGGEAVGGDVDVFTVEVYSVCYRDVFTFFFMFTFVSLLS